jgi:2-dehydro-3-deoxy-D-arabinonate dehydratase
VNGIRRVRQGGELLTCVAAGERLHPLEDDLFELLGAGLSTLHEAVDRALAEPPLEGEVEALAPVDEQEVWASGVTYERSRQARVEEAVVKSVYDLVFDAERPELFMKMPGYRVPRPGEPLRLRADSTWDVPEPELALVLTSDGEIAGYLVADDLSSRSIEGENPLYLPQAKIYSGSCSVGPVITLTDAMPPLASVEIQMTIDRGGKRVFEGATTLAQMARTPEELVEWLGKENAFPNGVLLLTGTGIVPPDEFTLASGDAIAISISGIGTLKNVVA